MMSPYLVKLGTYWLWQKSPIPSPAENIEDNLLLKNDFSSFQGTVATFYRWGGQKWYLLCQISSWFTVPQSIQIGSFLTELFMKYIGRRFLRHGVYSRWYAVHRHEMIFCRFVRAIWLLTPWSKPLRFSPTSISHNLAAVHQHLDSVRRPGDKCAVGSRLRDSR